MALITVVAALVAAPTPCNTQACVERVAMHRCADGHVGACIHRAALHHRVSEAWMRSIAWCESRMRPWVTNSSGHMGLYQYDSATWAGGPYARRGSPYSAKWASLQTAWYLRHGQASRWACA